MNNRLLFACFLFAFTFSCNEDETRNYPLLDSCNSLLGCGYPGNDVPFCTWGFKFGDNNPYSPSGPNIPGPKSKAVSISFKFLEAGVTFKTVAQNAALSMGIDDTNKDVIRRVILQWSSVADISFIEKASNEQSDITIASAFIPLSISDGPIAGLGQPAFVNAPCKQVAGLLVLSSKFQPLPGIILHEMGHVLGLGHVSSKNTMNPNSYYDRLQPGDIAGIQSIYGSK